MKAAPRHAAHVLPWTPKHNPWIIALTVTLATFMEVLDTSIANVALPHIAGNLSAGKDESTWVLSSYLVANAVILPISAWLATQFGRKRFYMTLRCAVRHQLVCCAAWRRTCACWFSSACCKASAEAGSLRANRRFWPIRFHRDKRGMAFAIYGMAVVMAPAIGPTLGGYITDNFDWRWIFFINVPVAHSFADSDVAAGGRSAVSRRTAKEDRHGRLGLGWAARVGIGALQVVLDKGERDDWFSSRLHRLFVITSVVCLITAIFLGVLITQIRWSTSACSRLEISRFRA